MRHRGVSVIGARCRGGGVLIDPCEVLLGVRASKLRRTEVHGPALHLLGVSGHARPRFHPGVPCVLEATRATLTMTDAL